MRSDKHTEHTANLAMSQAVGSVNVGKHFYAPAVKREQKPTKQRGFSFRTMFKSGKIGF